MSSVLRREWHDWQDSLAGKVFDARVDNLSSIPGIHMIGGSTWPPQVQCDMLLHICTNIHAHTKQKEEEMERWLIGTQLLLFFQKTQIQFPEPTSDRPQLRIILTSVDLTLSSLIGHLYTHVLHVNSGRHAHICTSIK